MDNFNVLLLENIGALAIRIRSVLESSNICVIHADNETKLFNNLAINSKKISLVILDINLKDEYAINLLIETRKRANNAPIIIITQGEEKKLIVEAMLQGVTDFIIKPFQNQVLVSKIIKYISPEEADKTEFVIVDLRQYLKGELRKAEKGKFPLSIMFLDFVYNHRNHKNNTNIISFIFKNLKDLFWDTDIFIRFLSKYYFGIFPFCDEKNKAVIDQKLTARIEELKKKEKVIKDYQIRAIWVSYPFDTTNASEIYDLLIYRIKEQLDNIQI